MLYRNLLAGGCIRQCKWAIRPTAQKLFVALQKTHRDTYERNFFEIRAIVLHYGFATVELLCGETTERDLRKQRFLIGEP